MMEKIMKNQQTLVDQEVIKRQEYFEVCKKYLFSYDFESLRKSNIHHFAVEMLLCLPLLLPFTDVQVEAKLRELRFNDKVLRWFIPVSEVLEMLDEIETNKNILFPKYHALYFILTY